MSTSFDFPKSVLRVKCMGVGGEVSLWERKDGDWGGIIISYTYMQAFIKTKNMKPTESNTQAYIHTDTCRNTQDTYTNPRATTSVVMTSQYSRMHWYTPFSSIRIYMWYTLSMFMYVNNQLSELSDKLTVGVVIIIIVFFNAGQIVILGASRGGSNDEVVPDRVVNVTELLAMPAGLPALAGGGVKEVALAALKDRRQVLIIKHWRGVIGVQVVGNTS